MNIRMKIQISVMLAVILPGIFISIILDKFVTDKAYEQFYDVSEREIRQVDNAMELFFNGVAQNVNSLATNPKIIAAGKNITSYNNNSESVIMTPSSNGGVESNVYEIYENFANSHDSTAYVYFGNVEGGYIQWPEGNMGANYDPRERPFYQQALKNKGKASRTDAYFYDGTALISTVATVHDSDGNVVGTQAVDVSLNGLTKIAKDIKLGGDGYIMILDGNGTILFDPKNPENTSKNIDSLADDVYKAISKLPSGPLSALVNDTEYEVNIVTSNALGWKFVGFVPKNEILKMSNSIISKLMYIEGFMLVIFLILSWKVSTMITLPIVKINEKLKEIASGEGDLTTRIKLSSKSDETFDLATSFNDFVEQICELVVAVKGKAESVNKLSNQVAKASELLAETTEEQNSQSLTMASALHEVSMTSKLISETVKGTEALSENSKIEVNAGGVTISESIKLMSSVADDMSSLKDILNELQSSSEKIDDITKLITGIADMTNLLALNAAIESARAGEAGRGFSVVADEVRELSGRTTGAATQIADLIQTVQSQSNSSYEHITELNSRIQASVEKGEESLKILQSITLASEKMANETLSVSTSIEEESKAIEEINENIQVMSSAIGDSANNIASIKEITEDLDIQASQLKALVEQFKT